jgi:hypothetical protein
MKNRQCHLAARGCVENQPQHFRSAAADAPRTAALQKFQIGTTPKNPTRKIPVSIAQFRYPARDEQTAAD